MKNTLVVAEHDNQQLKNSTLNVLTAAAQLGLPVDVLVAGAGSGSQKVAEQVQKAEGVSTVLLADDPAYEYPLAENMADLVVSLASSYAFVLAPATTWGKNFLPRAAALLDLEQISDVSAILTQDTFVRPIYAGNALATVQSVDPIKFLTIRCPAFPQASFGDKLAEIRTVDHPVKHKALSRFIALEASPSERPELTQARVIVSGGRGLQDAEKFKLIEALADKLHAAVGASRAAVDAGFAPNDYQVGQTGKIVAPDLYIAVGISGAIQHLAGMKDSRVIVAINKDPEAPIFKIATYGLVGDLFQILQELMAELDKG